MNPALVQRGRDQRADEDDGDEGRAVPQHDQDHRERGHHGERHERQLEIAAQRRRERDSSRARHDSRQERDVHDVERDERGDRSEREAAQRAVLESRRRAARGDTGEHVHTGVERDATERPASSELDERHCEEAGDGRRGPAVDRRARDEEDRRQRCRPHGDSFDRNRERLVERCRGDQEHDACAVVPRDVARREPTDRERKPGGAEERDRNPDGECRA